MATNLLITPQLDKLELNTTSTINVKSNADDFSVYADNQNVSFNKSIATPIANDPDYTNEWELEITANSIGNTHIVASATAPNDTETIVEWDLEVEDTTQTAPATPPATNPTTPNDPTNPLLPDYAQPIELQLHKTYINTDYKIVIPTNYLGNVRFANGEFIEVFECVVIENDNSHSIKHYTKNGIGAGKHFSHSAWITTFDKILELDNHSVEVYRNNVAFVDYAIADNTNTIPSGIVTYLPKNAISFILDNDNYTITIDNIKLNLYTETKLKQVKLYLGVLEL